MPAACSMALATASNRPLPVAPHWIIRLPSRSVRLAEMVPSLFWV